MLELIDTLWNVNLADNIWVRKLKCELIDAFVCSLFISSNG